MNQLQFYKFSAIALLVLNIAMIAFFFLTRPSPPGRLNGKELSKRAVDILKMDQQQNQAFLESARKHNEQMEALNQQQVELLKPYFNQLIQADTTVDQEALLLGIQQAEREKIEFTYQHFQEMKSFLHQEQHPYFEDFMKEVLNILFLKQGRNLPPPRKK